MEIAVNLGRSACQIDDYEFPRRSVFHLGDRKPREARFVGCPGALCVATYRLLTLLPVVCRMHRLGSSEPHR